MASIDVLSLFTNVQATKTIDFFRNLLSNDPSLHNPTKLDALDVTYLVDLHVKATFITFRDRILQQTTNLPMHPQISWCLPTSSWNCLKTSAPVIPTVRWMYVEDTFALIEKTSITRFHDEDESIVFTKEGGDNEKNSFLDC